MTVAITSDEFSDQARLRSGAAARLAGLPVTTLRVWERRYGVVAAPKSAKGQRLYSAHDVQRLTLLKQLTERGHAIGTIATLARERLESLLSGAVDRRPDESVEIRRIVVVGRAVARKLGAVPGLEVLAIHEDLDAAAEQAAPAASVDLLLVHLASLQPASAERVLGLKTRLNAAAVVVLYAFGTQRVAESLRAAGATLRRAPIGSEELASLLGAARWRPAPSAEGSIEPRRFSDDALAALVEAPNGIVCECPRHLAELVAQLAGFERYSAECLSRSPGDAALHRQLSGLAGAARTMFERALERVVADDEAKGARAGGAL